MVKLLYRGRKPPIDPPEPATPPGCVVVLGRTTASSFTSPPMVLMGSCSATVPENPDWICEEVTATGASPSAVTSTVVDTVPNSRTAGASTVWLGSTLTCARTYLLNPSLVTSTV